MKDASHMDYARTNDLTVEEVKACPMFAHLTDSEAEEVIATLKIFSKITYDFYENNRKRTMKNE